MPNIRDLNVSSAEGDTSFVIYDASSGATRRCSIDSVSEYVIKQIPTGSGASVVSGTYSNGTLTLHMSYGPDIVITGWADLGGVTFDGNEIESISFNGGLEGRYNAQTKALSVDMISNQAIGNYFLGIYHDLASLQAAVRNPKDNYQAIILSPDEEYYHVVAGQWVELAPVVNVHPSYIGAFDTEAALNSAGGSAQNGSLAIVGTDDHAFYVKKAGAWTAIKGADLPSLVGRVAALESAKQSMEQSLQTKISGIHIEDEDNNTADSARTINLSGLFIESQSGSAVTIAAKKQITVSNGADQGSTTQTGEAVEFPGASIATRNEGKIVQVTFPAGSNTLIVSDKTNTEYTASKLQFPTASIFQGGDENTYVVDVALGVNAAGDSDIQNVTDFEFDKSIVEDITQQGEQTRKVRVTPDFSSVEAKSTPSYLAFFGNPIYIGYSESATPVHTRDVVYPEEIVVDSNDMNKIGVDRDAMTFTLNKLDGFDSTDYLVSVRLSFRDYAWSDGYIKVSIEGEDALPIQDVYGVPMSVEHMYVNREKFEAIQLTSIIRVAQTTVFQIVCDTDLMEVQPVITPRNESASGILIQSLTHLSKTSDAMQQFEQEIGEKIPVGYRVFGGEIFNLDYLNAPDRGPFVAGAPSALWRSDGQMFHSLNGFNWKVENGEFSMWDNGQQMDGSFAKIFDAVSTQFLHGKQISINIEYSSDSAWQVNLLKWTGAPDGAQAGSNTELFSTRPLNGQPTWKAGWTPVYDVDTVVDCSTTGAGNYSTASGTFTVPNDAVQFALILYPIIPAQPAFFKLRSLTGSLSQQITGWVLGTQSTIGEPSSRKVNDLITYVQDNQGTGGISYPIGSTETPMPFGKLVTWHETVPAPAVNPVNADEHRQRAGEGGLLLESEGVLEFSPTQLLIRNTGSNDQTVTFVYKVKHSDNTTATITDSSTTFTVRASNGSGQFFKMKSFKYHCKLDDVIYLVATASGASGLDLWSFSAGMPLLKGSFVYKKILPSTFYDATTPSFAFGVAQVDTTDTKYAPSTANVAATLPLNTIYQSSSAANSVNFSNANDTVSISPIGLYKLDYKAHLIRTQQWAGAVKFSMWVEYSANNGATWQVVNGSVARMNVPADYPATAIPMTLTFPFEVTASPTMLRGRYIADVITNGIGLQSYAASGDFPQAAAWQLTCTKVQGG